MIPMRFIAVRLPATALLCLALTACSATDASHSGANGSAAPTTRPGTSEVDKHVLQSSSGDYLVRYRLDPATVPLNETFAIDVEIVNASNGKPADDLALSVDGRMPEHRHGMNVEPVIKKSGPGAYRVEGMLFHMPGRWEIHFDLTRGGMTERAWMEVMLE